MNSASDACVKLALKNLPPLSPLAPELLEIDWQDDAAEQKLLRVIGSDAALGARLLATANSVAYAAPGTRYTNIVSALRRLGLRRAIHLTTSWLFAGPLLQSLPPGINQALWLHSLALAFAAQELSRVKRLPEPNAAYFIGLVHDIGYLAMEYLQPGTLARIGAEAAAQNISQEQAEVRIFGIEHQEVAAQVLGQWGVPADLVAPLGNHHALDYAPDSLAAILFGAEKLARCDEVAEVLYAGLDHPFAPLTIDRLGIEFLFEQQLALGNDAVDTMTRSIIDQVDNLRDAAASMVSSPRNK